MFGMFGWGLVRCYVLVRVLCMLFFVGMMLIRIVCFFVSSLVIFVVLIWCMFFGVDGMIVW